MICRVCGMTYVTPRWDSKTCSTTCRQRLRQGHEFAYLEGRSEEEREAARKYHADTDEWQSGARALTALVKTRREHRRQERNERARAEIGGRAYLKVMEVEQEKQHQQMLGHVAVIIKLWTQERRNDLSAEAIAEFFRIPEFTVEVVAGLITELRASGEYDRIVAEANSGS